MSELVLREAVIVSKEGSIQFSNFDEIKTNVLAVLDKYKGLTLTVDNKQFIKSEKAQLNNVSKALNDERIKVKKDYMIPLEKLEDQVKEITNLIKETVNSLDLQVKFDEDWEKAIKENELRNYFNELVKAHKIDFITFEDANLNITLTATEKKLKEELDAFIGKVLLDLQEINSDVNRDRLLAKYRLSKDLQQSRIQLNHELQQEAFVKEFDNVVERIANNLEQVPNVPGIHDISPEAPWDVAPEETQSLDFTVITTKTKIKKLIQFLESEGIDYI